MAYKSNFAQILKKIETEVKGEVEVQTEALDNEARSLIQDTKSGRFYGAHQASNKDGGTSSAGGGEPWANWTGETRASFFTEQRDSGFTGVFGATSPVALFMEYGTTRVGPRPLFRPVLENRTQPILSGLAAALKRGTS